LFAARGFENPLIYSNVVGIDFALSDPGTDEDETAVQPTPTQPTRVRLINGVVDKPNIDFYFDDSLIAPEIAFGTGSNFIVIPEGLHVFTIHDPETDQLLGRVEGEFESGNDYTIYGYGNSANLPLSMGIAPNFEIERVPQSASVRLINLSTGEPPQLGFGYTVATENVTQPGPEDGYRRTMEFGVNIVVRETWPGEIFSPPAYIPAGTHNLHILETSQTELALILTNVQLEGDQHYDIVAYQQENSPQVVSFIIAYPES
jgi:hypothetical protein